jgi:Carbohydrate binding module (family 6)
VINGQTPFFGLPQSIPGIIQAEDFDNGGEGVAYHDTSLANEGGQYRGTGVDVENCGDTGGSYNVGFTGAGEWLQYSVNATVDGIYSIGTRVATSGNAGTFHLEIDGQNVTGTMIVNDTGGWQSWQTLTKTNVNIGAGSHLVRLALDTTGPSGTVGNYNYLIFTVTGTNPPPVVLQSATAIGGVFADEGGAVVNPGAKTVTVPKSANTRFYRLRSSVATHIKSVQFIGSNVALTYE